MSIEARYRYRVLRDRVLPPATRRRRAHDRALTALRRAFPELFEPPDAYKRWYRSNRLGWVQLARQRRQSRAWGYRPLISVVTPVYDVAEVWLRACVDSVLAQSYERWELCLVNDGSKAPHVAPVLASYAARDRRIRVETLPHNSGITAASARGLQMARGDFVALLDHDDALSRDALAEVVRLLNQDPCLDLVYSDEDRLEPNGRRVEPFFKPDWSPDLLLSMNYICHLGVYRRSVLEQVGGFRPGYDGSQDWDLVLRFTEATQRIGHVPRMLYHWRKVPSSVAAGGEAKLYAFTAGQRAVEDALRRRGRPGKVEMTTLGRYRVRYALEHEPKVSILIPTRDRADILRTCIESILAKSTYANYEILVLDNDSEEQETLALLAGLRAPHRSVRFARPFNWSAINNFGVEQARGEYLVLLNNDTEVIEPGWIEAMLGHAQHPEVGVVGAKLLYPDGHVQHAGVIVGIGETAGHAFKGIEGSDPGYIGMAAVARNYSAVTGACMMVRRDVFESVGGIDEHYEVAYSDIDFCLKVTRRGLRVVFTPDALLYHHESATRGELDPPEDKRRFRERWAEVIARDPFYNPNLTRTTTDFGVGS